MPPVNPSAMWFHVLKWYEQASMKISNLDATFWWSFLLGLVIVSLYSSEKYNCPSYARTAIGDMAPLAPKLLASPSRYRRGLLFYLLSQCGVYAVICIIGLNSPAILKALLPSFFGSVDGINASNGINTSNGIANIWPILAATTLMASGKASDDNWAGVLEAFFRRWAHEIAYIPHAVRILARQLEQLDIGHWVAAAEGRAQNIITAAGLPKSFPIEKETDGSLASWIRANIILHSLEKIDADAFVVAASQAENGDAMHYLQSLHGSIKSWIKREDFDAGKVGTVSETNDIDLFLHGTSTMLSSALVQAFPKLQELNRRLLDFGLTKAEPLASPGRSQFIAFIIVNLICCGLFITAITYFIFANLKAQDVNLNLLRLISETVVPLCIVCMATFLIGYLLRDRLIRDSKWHERIGGGLMFDIKTVALTTISSAIVIALLVLPIANWSGVGISVMIMVCVLLSTLSAICLRFHFRAAARSGSEFKFFKHIFSPPVVAQCLGGSLVAFTAVSVVNLFPPAPDSNEFPHLRSALAIACSFLSLVLALAIRHGRSMQLWGAMDVSDTNTLERLKQAFYASELQKNGQIEFEQWLIKPLDVLNLVTPLEGVRYDKLRSKIFDELRRSG